MAEKFNDNYVLRKHLGISGINNFIFRFITSNENDKSTKFIKTRNNRL